MNCKLKKAEMTSMMEITSILATEKPSAKGKTRRQGEKMGDGIGVKPGEGTEEKHHANGVREFEIIEIPKVILKLQERNYSVFGRRRRWWVKKITTATMIIRSETVINYRVR